MATLHKYSILITFAHPNPDLAAIQSRPVSYQGARTDTFCFNAQSIRIYANRYYKIHDNNIDLYQKTNLINLQIHKAIELYYATCSVYTHVRSINIKIKTNSSKSKYKDYITANTFTQPLPRNIKGVNTWKFAPNDMLPMLGIDAKANAYQIALSYCLKSATENTDFAKFSNLWRAFNALYRYHSNSSMDSRGLRSMEAIIRTHYMRLSLCRTMIPNYASLLTSLRWRKFIINKISIDKSRRPSHGTGTSDFLTHYHDYRINRIFNRFVNNIGIWFNIVSVQNIVPQNIQQHIQTNISAHRQIQREILMLLIKDYAYFLRNTLFHGAVDEPSFTLGTTQEQKELKMASVWLENLIKDLLNNHLI